MPAALDAAAVPEELPAMLDDDAAMILFPRRLQSSSSASVCGSYKQASAAAGMLWAKTKVLKAKETRKCRHVLSSAFLPAATCSSAAPTPKLSTWTQANDRQSSNLTEKKQ